MKPIFNYTDPEKRARRSMHASDCEKMGVDILLSLKSVPETNPNEWNDYLRMASGKGVELKMIEVLKQNGAVEKDFDQDKVDATELIYKGMPIRMRFDARVKDGGAVIKAEGTVLPNSTDIVLNPGEPIEIKTINNANDMDIQRYITGNPRSSYVKQLAVYMRALGLKRGHLFVAAIDGQNYFWFVCEETEEGVYKCGETVVNLTEELERLYKIWQYKDTEIPNELWFEEIYKLPIDQIDWSKLSVSRISNVRNNRYVVGSENKWKIDYSPWKKIILEKQGVVPGYSDEEIETIKSLTAGYSSKKK